MKLQQKSAVGVVIFWLMMTGSLKAEVNFINLVRKIRPAVVTVFVYDANHQVSGIGSGFLLPNTDT